MDVLSKLCSAFGLAGAAGLNAYIPLLTVGLMANRGVIHLAAPYDALGQWWCISLLIVLLIVEIVVDKIPGADHVNDIIHSAIRPAAGAVAFASQAGVVSGVHPAVWLIIGLLMSGGVHTVKALTRPAVNIASAGIGAPILSTIEDLVSTTLSIVAILLPFLAVILLGVFGWLLFKMFRHFFNPARRARARAAVPPIQAKRTSDKPKLPTDQPIPVPATRWGGGV